MDIMVQKALLCVRFIKGVENINKIIEEWDDLYKRADNAQPYYSRVWVHSFISKKESKGTPTLITAWSGSKLVALMPLTIRNYFGVKVAIGTPTDMLCCTGILVDSRYQQAVELIAESCIKENIAHVFCNRFTSSHDELTNKFFDTLARYRLVSKRWERQPCLKASLEPDFDLVLRRNRSTKQRLKLLYHERRIYKSGDVKITRYDGNEITQEIIQRIVAIQINSWKKKEGNALLEKAFFQELLMELGQAEIGCIWLVTKDEDDVAFIYALRRKDNLYPKWMAYKLKYGSSTLSYGRIMCMQMIRDACSDNISKIDFGFGEDSWKHLWVTDKDVINMIICGRGLIGRFSIIFFSILKKFARYKWLLHQYIKKHKLFK